MGIMGFLTNSTFSNIISLLCSSIPPQFGQLRLETLCRHRICAQTDNSCIFCSNFTSSPFHPLTSFSALFSNFCQTHPTVRKRVDMFVSVSRYFHGARSNVGYRPKNKIAYYILSNISYLNL